MSDLRFGQFLINKDLITEEDLNEALWLQRKATPPIGKLSVRGKKLSIKQVNRILSAQIDTAKKFGAVAIELGYLVQEDVDELLLIQKTSRPKLGEILIQMGKIDRSRLGIELIKFEALITLKH
jgi:hypothetical protein